MYNNGNGTTQYQNDTVPGKDQFAGRKVVILGLARQGLALARFFATAGARVVVSDLAAADTLQAEVKTLETLNVEHILGSHPDSLLDNCDLLCLSGGVPLQAPFVQKAIQRDIPLSNDSLLTFQLAKQMGLSPLIAITGSSGKTTTTALAGQMLEGYRAHVGGNIGAPLLDRLPDITPGQPLVLELSSFQLELFDPNLAWGDLDQIGPSVATITNITPNHLDRHTNMAAYTAAKLNLLHYMAPGSELIVNLDDPVMSRLAPPVKRAKRKKLPADWRLDDMLAEARAALDERGVEIVPVSRLVELDEGAWLVGNTLTCAGEPIVQRDEVQLLGDHNVSNLLVAMALAHCAGADAAHLGQVARTFNGVAHRLEVVAEHAGVTWINDSIATSPERSVAAMRSFDPDEYTLILLAGGKDKNLPWDTFANEVVARVSFLIGFGESGPMLVRTAQERARFSQQKAPNCAVVQRLDEAVELANRIATSKAVVMLSPGGTSFDAYKDFAARGEHFRRLVRRIIGDDSDGASHGPRPSAMEHETETETQTG